MALLEQIEADGGLREQIRAAAGRRQSYLAGRASWRGEAAAAEPDEGGPPLAPAGEPGPAVASLWLEAAETALFVGDVRAARGNLVQAVRALGPRQPFARAMQRMLMPWAEPVQARDAQDAPPDAAARSVWSAFDSRRDHVRLAGHDAVSRAPVGRMAVPASEVLAVAGWSHAFGDAAQRDRALVQRTLQRALDHHLAALEEARHNRYLWARLLSPVSLFDLDLAVLLAAGLHRPDAMDASPSQMAVRALPEDARAFGDAWLQTLAQLRQRDQG